MFTARVGGFVLGALRAMVERRWIPAFNPRLVFSLIGAIFVAAAIALAVWSHLALFPLHKSGWERFLSPIETAPHRRIAFTNTGFNAVSASPDGKTVMAVGDNGLFLLSNDAGASWKQVQVPPVPSTSGSLEKGSTSAPFNTFIIYFDFGKSNLTSTAMDVVLEGLKTHDPRRYRASVVGYSDAATALEQPQLARQRAESIARLLKQSGYGNSNVQVSSGVISTMPLSTGKGVREPQNRRVVLTFFSLGAALPGAPNLELVCATGGLHAITQDYFKVDANPDGSGMVVDPSFIAEESATLQPSGACATPRTVRLDDDARIAMIISDGQTSRSLDSFVRRPGTNRDRVLVVDNFAHTTLLSRAENLPLELALPAGSEGRGGFVGTKAQRWVVTSDGAILNAGPADKAWKIATVTGPEGKPRVLNTIFFLNDDKTGWGAGKDGVVYKTFDAGAHWIEGRPLSDRSEIRGVSFVDSLRGWAAGAGGVYGTVDGGESWSPAALTPDRLGKWIDDDSRSYSLEAPGVLRVCPQAGQKSKHCADLALNILVPPLAAWLALLLAMATFGLAVMSPSELTAAAADDPQSAATAYASDKPLVAGQPDILKLDNIARGLADFLVNRRTEPPLSLAIDGPWGSGKSSLLNLFTQSELSQRRFGVVWFNAWHHEKEENTLGAILTMICRDAIAGPFSALGLMLRWNLLRQRIQKNPLRYLLGASILIFAVAYVWVHPQHTASVLRQSWANLQGLLAGTDVAKNLPAGALGENAPGWLRFFSLSLLLLFVFYNLRTSLSTFAAAAKWSLPRIVFTRDRRNLMSDVGLRNRFAKEFAAVTKALRPRRLVIVIDDLDRCQPEKVVEILQLTNFLMSSGDCFVIIAADLNWVEACVREQYKKVGEVLAHGPHATAPNGEQAADNLADFSNRYLRKIINVMIRVPKLTPALARDFIQGESMDGARAGAGPKVSLFGRAIRAVGLVTAIVLPIALVQIYPNLGEPPPPVVQGKVTIETVPGPSTGNRPVEAAAPSASSEPAVEKPGKRLLVRPPEAEGPVSIFWFLLPILILAFFGWVAWQVWRVVEATRTTDSRAFTVALQRWGQAIFIATPTPRDIRRFTNQARYLSAQRKYFEGSNLKIDELARFAALEFIDREWFDSLDGPAIDALTAQLADGVVGALPQEWGDVLRRAVVAAYQDELRSSEPSRPSDSSDESAVDKFRNLTASSKLA